MTVDELKCSESCQCLGNLLVCEQQVGNEFILVLSSVAALCNMVLRLCLNLSQKVIHLSQQFRYEVAPLISEYLSSNSPSHTGLNIAKMYLLAG